MKLCQNCGQALAEEITSCPSCGSEVAEGRKFIDDYRIEKVLHEGYASILCKGRKAGLAQPVMIRIFTARSGVDQKIADRLKNELEELKKLPEDYFVRHLDIRKSSDGLWYRVSEWVDAENWSHLLSGGRLQDLAATLNLFRRIASILEGLHQIGHFIPHLIIDDIMVMQGEGDALKAKIDYKLSRFLNPKIDRPGPTLKKLLACHPDIVNGRPLDYRSDIWSLGKIFVEVLSGDFESIDFLAAIDRMPLPREVGVLLKTMLAEDPDLRPRSMAEVAQVLSRVDSEDIEATGLARREVGPAPVKQIKGLNRRLTLLVIMVALLGLLVGALAWYYWHFRKADSATILFDYANRYAGSVAFIVVDYRLLDGNTAVYRNRTEGTAFLVDREGYLLTNRHVACPWLEDRDLLVMVQLLKQNQRPLRLDYRAFLWFEGQKAFNRLPGLDDSIRLEDVYALDSSFSTQGARRLIIAGVAKAPTKTWQLVKAPLKDDFAVLKIDPPPEGIKPLPLDAHMDPLKVPRLSPIVTLGFPLGSRTQETTVNVSATQGHVRRTFENMLQVDTSLHSGNSGGPVVDIHGKVIGIASGVATGWALGPVPVVTPLSDIGMILPITGAVKFIQELKRGRSKWNGVPDLSMDEKLRDITERARQGRWEEAEAMAERALDQGFDPLLVMASGMLRFCVGDDAGARQRFTQALSIDDENGRAKLMVYLIDWRAGKAEESVYRRELLALDWRSPHEFFGYLVKVLEESTATDPFSGGYTGGEKSWLRYLGALMRAKRGALAESEKLLKEAVLLAEVDDWLYLQALAALQKVQQRRLDTMPLAGGRGQYQAEMKTDADNIQKHYTAKIETRKRLASLAAQLKQPSLAMEDKEVALKGMLQLEPANGEILTELAFASAANEKWEQALAFAQKFLEIRGRENAERLSVGLLEAETLHRVKRSEASRAGLEDFCRRTRDPWYRSIGEALLGRMNEPPLSRKAEENPENLVTWHTALGFWAEGSGDDAEAIRHYKEALGSYMDTRPEYEFAKERIRRLRKRAD